MYCCVKTTPSGVYHLIGFNNEPLLFLHEHCNVAFIVPSTSIPSVAVSLIWCTSRLEGIDGEISHCS